MLMNRFHILAAAVGALSLMLPQAFGESTIDASRATHVNLPTPSGVEAVSFTTPDGKQGWVKRLSTEAIPTPAYANGRIFTGTGISAHEFLAIDAATGRTIWNKSGRENGPTSPVIEGKYVCYNTESCDTETRDIDTGDMVWEETTGGSLLTQPVVAENLFIIPHPTMARTNKWSDNTFRMLAVDTKDGKHHWDADMTQDVMGAPIAADGRIYFACTDGRLFSMAARSGASSWHTVANATSAPVVVGNILAVTTEEKRTLGGATVSIRRFKIEDGSLIDKDGLMNVSIGSAVATNRAGWDYQGPKIAAAGKHLFNAPGQMINSMDIDTGKSLWQAVIRGNGITDAANSLTPPALGKNNVYLGSTKGHILAVRQSDGGLVFAYNVGVPLASQPILADGNIYFGTANGLMVCLKVDNADAKDWSAWGGNSGHNKVD